ncbi:hypothetical protein HDV05_005899 [Chytridiales sp. JEL 0842]|nr:hypothetical protein HDV05_005899 [Chytridiales sp. JEL 0842]
MKFTQVVAIALISSASVQASQVTDLLQTALSISQQHFAARSLFARQDAGNATETTATPANDVSSATSTTSSVAPSATPIAAGGCEDCASSVGAAQQKCNQIVQNALALAATNPTAALSALSGSLTCACNDVRNALSCASTVTGTCPVDLGPLNPPYDLQTLKTEAEASCKPGANGRSCVDAAKSSVDMLSTCATKTGETEAIKCVCGLVTPIVNDFKASCTTLKNVDAAVAQFNALKAECDKRGFKSGGSKSVAAVGAASVLSMAAALLL